MESSFDHAKAYADLGWSYIPCQVATKKPATRTWTKFQEQGPTLAQSKRWFGGKEKNIAVVLGDVSGGLAVRDFDEKTEYERWKSGHTELAALLPTVKTSKGFHVYCRMDPCPRLRVQGVTSGELRANGSYVVAPPSIHPNGTLYEWINPPTEDIAEVSLADLDLEAVLHSQHSQQSQPSQPMPTEVVGGDAFEDAILASVPSGPGQRNQRLFDLARRLKGIPNTPTSVDGLTEIFDLWWDVSRNIITTQDYAASLDDFLRACDNAQTAYGETMQFRLRQAVADGYPAWVPKKSDDRCKLLASLCRVLQRANGDEPFYLSAHTGADLLGTKPMTCWRWLSLFARLKKVIKVETGNLAQRKASRFRYVADDL